MKRLVTFTLRTLTAVPSYQDIITPSFFTSLLFPPCLHGSCTYKQQPCTTAHWDRSTLLLGSCSQWGGNPCQPQGLRAAAMSEKTILYSLCLFNSILCTSKYLHFYLSSNSSSYNELSTSWEKCTFNILPDHIKLLLSYVLSSQSHKNLES